MDEEMRVGLDSGKVIIETRDHIIQLSASEAAWLCARLQVTIEGIDGGSDLLAKEYHDANE